MEKNEKEICCTDIKSINKYPGLAIDVADGEKIDNDVVKEEAEALNNNPRNNGKII